MKKWREKTEKKKERKKNNMKHREKILNWKIERKDKNEK